jgi:hypothetical protein
MTNKNIQVIFMMLLPGYNEHNLAKTTYLVHLLAKNACWERVFLQFEANKLLFKVLKSIKVDEFFIFNQKWLKFDVRTILTSSAYNEKIRPVQAVR